MTVLTEWILGNSGTTVGKNIGDDFSGAQGRPKHKFNFTMTISFRSNAPDNQGAESMEVISIPLKQATRPNINVQYADINFYGFRGKVATRTDYGVVSVTFYDDVANQSHTILKNYLEELSPIASYTKEQASQLENENPTSVGHIRSNRHGIIAHMRITHYYRQGQEIKKTHYDYLNPKVQNFTLDELDMSQSDTSVVTLTFIYDSVNIVEE